MSKAIYENEIKENLNNFKLHFPELVIKEPDAVKVEMNGLRIKQMENPSDMICFKAIQSNPYSIEYVTNQSEKMALMAVSMNPLTLEYVTNKTFKVCKRALQKSRSVIRFIEDFSNFETEELVDLYAVYQGYNKYEIQNKQLFKLEKFKLIELLTK